MEQVLAAAGRRPAGPGRAPDSSAPLTGAAAILHLQRLAGNESVNALLDEEQVSPVHEVVASGGGVPLDAGVRGLMEERLGEDFSDVRVHTGGKADESARALAAQAYTVGSEIVFRSGAYQPDTPGGQRVIAHELAHVVQQRAGPVAGTPAPGGIRLSHPTDPFEQAAEQVAEAVTKTRAIALAPESVLQRAEEEKEKKEEAPAAQPLTAQPVSEEEEEELA